MLRPSHLWWRSTGGRCRQIGRHHRGRRRYCGVELRFRSQRRSMVPLTLPRVAFKVLTLRDSNNSPVCCQNVYQGL